MTSSPEDAPRNTSRSRDSDSIDFRVLAYRIEIEEPIPRR
jgi:hypothetical protein